MQSDLVELEKLGASARALGRDEFDNPFLKQENLPAATGDSVEVWQAKYDAWDRGMKIEDAIRA